MTVTFTVYLQRAVIDIILTTVSLLENVPKAHTTAEIQDSGIAIGREHCFLE